MENWIVDILLAVGVAAQLLCSLGMLVMRTTYDRLHYSAASTTVGPLCVLAALLLREGFGQFGLDGIATVALLLLPAPLVVHATARAARAHRR